ncbi:pyocin activator PrtN family protein [Shewanella insulae]|uniref:pyocin activator PrtN family protein n=1 Tax=Shewanella insulae TaxID=2681496 RepID=UPI002480E2FE|nr:pyocin activator PrtN family protein [Shewanella insulae]
MPQSSNRLTKTHQLLLAQFSNRAVIPLDEIAEPFLGLSVRTAKNRAKAGLLPFAVFKMTDSAKCPYLVHLDDLADYIDKQNRKARAGRIR